MGQASLPAGVHRWCMNFLTIGTHPPTTRHDRNVRTPLRWLWLVLASAVALAVVAGCRTSAPTATLLPTPTESFVAHDLHAWPELEALLPDIISGRELAKVSLAAHPERQNPKTLAVLAELGRSATDLQIANAELEGTDLMVGAMRIVGSEGSLIIDAFEKVDGDDPNSPAAYTDVDFGGKRVTARTVDGKSSYLYGSGDMMFIVSGERALVEAALELLP